MNSYEQTITDPDGDVTTTKITAEQAAQLMLRSVNHPKARHLVVSKTGVITLRLRPTSVGATVGRKIVLTPLDRRTLTTAQGQDLEEIHRYANTAHLRDNGRIQAGLYSIPPAASQLLIDRGLVEVTDNGRCSVSFRAKMEFALHVHKTRTTQPRGRHSSFDSDHPHMRGLVAGKINDSTSVALCTCGWSKHAHDRLSAAREADTHRTRSVLLTVLAINAVAA